MAKLGEFRVLTLRETPAYGKAETPDHAADYWRKNIDTDPRHNPDVETLVCLVLNTRRDILGHFIVATGTLDTLLCHAREVYRPALVANAAAIVVMHCHPSGDATPSEADIKVTRDLIRAGQLLKVELLDHVIMGTATADQRQVEVRLTLRFVVRLEDALRFVLIARFETRLNAGDFVFEVEDAPGTPDQTECLFHGFTHGYANVFNLGSLARAREIVGKTDGN
ncbi:MAG TPA: JAB domain-containing protein [Candidatus Acidoferrum sp.]|nr:JAB domain-containing protein [Candidatus Acidoferrum sp.]